MLSRQHRLDAHLLQRAERPPSEGVYDVVLDERVESIKGIHTSRGMSSTDLAAMRLRSWAETSSLRNVSL